MANRDFELEMKMKADFASADRASERTIDNVNRIGNAVREANAEMSSLGAGAGGGEGFTRQAQSADALTASLGRNAEARKAIDQASRLTQQAVTAEIGAIRDLQERLAAGAGSFDDLADTEARLDAAMARGLLTAEEYDEALEKLNQEQARLERGANTSAKALDGTVARYDRAGAALKRLEGDERKLKEAVDAGRISREQYNRAMSGIASERARLKGLADGADAGASAMRRLGLATAGAQRDITMMLTAAARGDWGLAGNQILQMGNRAGMAGVLFRGAGLAIGGTLGVVAGAVAVYYAGYQQMRAFEGALVATGNMAGVTAGQMAAMRNQVAGANGEYASAQQSLVMLAGSGKLAGDALQSAASAAVNLAELTGRSIEDTTNEIIRLADAPSENLLALNEKYHFLTLEVYENVKSLEEQGRAQDAAKLATDTLAQATEERAAQMRASAGTVQRAWWDVRDAIKTAIQAAKDFGRDDAQARMEAGARGIRQQRDNIRAAADDLRAGRISAERANAAILAAQKRIATEQANMRGWADKRDQELAPLREAEANQRAQDKALKATSDINADLARGATNAEKQAAAVKKLNQQFDALFANAERNNTDPALLTGVIRNADGSYSGGAYDARRKQITEEFKGPKAPKGRKPPKPKETEEQKAEEAAIREIENLQKQVALLEQVEDGNQRASEAARVNWEIEHGAYQKASRAVQDALIDNAQLLDQERARREEQEKTRKETEKAQQEWEKLRDSLRTPMEVALDDVTEKVRVLNAHFKEGNRESLEYKQSVASISRGAFTDAPTFGGLAPEVAGPFGELGKIDEARNELGKWYSEQLAMLDEFRRTKADMNAQWDEQEAAVHAQHQQRTAALNAAQTQVMLAGASSMFGNMAEMAKAYGGEQSKTYRALFALSKGFAVAQAAVALAQNVSEASKYGYPQNIPFIAAAFAQGAQIISLLSAANFNGGGQAYATGGHVRGAGTGTSDSISARLSDYEFVTRAAIVRQPGALQFLEEFNRVGMSAVVPYSQYADGGLVEAMQRPRLTAPDWGEIGRASATPPSVNNRMRVYVLQDEDQLAQRLAQHPKMEKAVVAYAGQNGQAIRANWS